MKRPRRDFVIPRNPEPRSAPVEPPLLCILGYFNVERVCPICGAMRVVYVCHNCPENQVKEMCKACAEEFAQETALGIYVRKIGERTAAIWAKDALPAPDPAKIKRAYAMNLERRVEAQAARPDALEDDL
jgi:hypothetical protein